MSPPLVPLFHLQSQSCSWALSMTPKAAHAHAVLQSRIGLLCLLISSHWLACCICSAIMFMGAVHDTQSCSCPCRAAVTHRVAVLTNLTPTGFLVASAVQSCSWALSMTPKVGWGDSPTAAARPEGGTSQKATAGWLSMLSVFEPHWQVGCRFVGYQYTRQHRSALLVCSFDTDG